MIDFPDENWKWLIATIIALIAAVATILTLMWPDNKKSKQTKGNDSPIVGGDYTKGDKITGDKHTHINDPETIIQVLEAKGLLKTAEKLQDKDDTIKALTETIERLEKDWLRNKQVLEKLGLGESRSAIYLLMQSIEENRNSEHRKILEKDEVDEQDWLIDGEVPSQEEIFEYRAKALEEEAQDWVDVGNIARLHNTDKALEYYKKAIALDPRNTMARTQFSHTQRILSI